jgi:predicted Zn-dependent protease
MTACLAGAAILITEPALEILTSEELQAVVAHELGHEYYWGEFEMARQHQRYLEIQELELRCDGIGIITLNRLGLNPESLRSAIVKLDKHNQQYGSINSANYVSSEERFRFIRSMIVMTRAGNKSAPALAWK